MTRWTIAAALWLGGCVGAEGPMGAMGAMGEPGAMGEQGQQGSQGQPGMNAMTVNATVEATSGADQPIASGVVTKMAFPNESYDTANMHDAATNTRLVAPADGIYLLTAGVKWRASGAGTQRFATVRKNGGSSDLGITQVAPVQSAGTFTSTIISTQIKLTAGEFVEILVLQDSGASLNLVNACAVQMTWIAPG